MNTYDKKRKLATRVTLFITLGLILAFSILTVIIAVTTTNQMTAKQEEELRVLADTNAKTAKSFMQTMVDKQTILIEAIKSLETVPIESHANYISNFIGMAKSGEQNILSLYYTIGSQPEAPNGFTVYATSGEVKREQDQSAMLSVDVYNTMSKDKNMIILDPHEKNIDGKKYLVISVLLPILDSQNNFVGVVGSDIDTAMLNAAEYNTGGYKTFSSAIVCGHQTIIMNTLDDSTIGEKFRDVARSIDPELTLNVANTNVPTSFLDTFKDGSKDYKAIVPFYVGTSKTVWLSITTVNYSEFVAPVISQVITVIIVCVIGLILLALICYLIIDKSLKPIRDLEISAREIARGNLNVNIVSKTNDEIGALAGSFLSVRNTIGLLTEKINILAHDFKQGEIDAQIPEDDFQGEYKNVVASINATIGGLIKDVLDILECLNQFGKGNFNVSVMEYPGKKIVATNNLNSLKNNLANVSKDVDKLISAAIDGNLETRVNTNIYEGDWRKLTDGLNNLLKAVSDPINEANRILSQLSAGNFAVSVSKNYKGTFSDMMLSFETMVASTNSYISEITDVLKTMAYGDLSKSINRQYVGQFDLIKQSINDITQALRETIQEINVSAEHVLTASNQIEETSMDLAQGAVNQASSVEELSASITEISSQVKKNAQNSNKANEIADEAVVSIENSNEHMQKLMAAMDEINENSAEISKIIKSIEDFAVQTNMLAINAAIEAARAGQAGKGFAVVASEVRDLAGKSAEAAKNTKKYIEVSISSIEEGVKLAGVTANALLNVVESVKVTSTELADITRATNEQSTALEHVVTGIEQISAVVQTNSAASEQSAAASEELLNQAKILEGHVAKFKL